MTTINTSYIDFAEKMLNQTPAADVLWRGEATRIVRKWINGNQCFALINSKSGEVLAHAAYYCPSPSYCRPCWAGIVQDPARPFACILGKLIVDAENIDASVAWA